MSKERRVCARVSLSVCVSVCLSLCLPLFSSYVQVTKRRANGILVSSAQQALDMADFAQTDALNSEIRQPPETVLVAQPSN